MKNTISRKLAVVAVSEKGIVTALAQGHYGCATKVIISNFKTRYII